MVKKKIVFLILVLKEMFFSGMGNNLRRNKFCIQSNFEVSHHIYLNPSFLPNIRLHFCLFAFNPFRCVVLPRFQVVLTTIVNIGPSITTYGCVIFVSTLTLRSLYIYVIIP